MQQVKQFANPIKGKAGSVRQAANSNCDEHRTVEAIL